MKFGYAFSISSNKLLYSQIAILNISGCSEIFSEMTSEKLSKRTELVKLIKTVKAGDEVLITSLQNLSGDVEAVVELLETLIQRDVVVFILDISAFKTANYKEDKLKIDKTIIEALSSISLAKKHVLSYEENQHINTIKSHKYKGRKVEYGPQTTNKDKQLIYDIAVNMLKSGHISKVQIAKQLGISRSTVYKIMERASQKEKNMQHKTPVITSTASSIKHNLTPESELLQRIPNILKILLHKNEFND